MIEFFQTMIVLSLGWVALEAFILAHAAHADRRERRRVERLIAKKYPPTY